MEARTIDSVLQNNATTTTTTTTTAAAAVITSNYTTNSHTTNNTNTTGNTTNTTTNNNATRSIRLDSYHYGIQVFAQPFPLSDQDIQYHWNQFRQGHTTDLIAAVVMHPSPDDTTFAAAAVVPSPIRRIRHSEMVIIDDVCLAYHRYWLRIRWPGHVPPHHHNNDTSLLLPPSTTTTTTITTTSTTNDHRKHPSFAGYIAMGSSSTSSSSTSSGSTTSLHVDEMMMSTKNGTCFFRVFFGLGGTGICYVVSFLNIYS